MCSSAGPPVRSVSNTMAAEWCSRVLSETLANYPAPTIFNTDQGSQFTADVFTALLVKSNVQMGTGHPARWMVKGELWTTYLWNVFGEP